MGVPPTGLTNWYQRGGTISTLKSLQEEVLLDTATGSKRQMIMAVRDSAYAPANPMTLTIPLVAEQQTARDFRQYTYRKEGAFNSINGLEDGSGKKVLRYSLTGSNPDVVEVFVDGVKRSRGAGANDYQLFDASPSSSVPPNTVLFNTAVISASTQVDVVVTKAATQSTVTLSLTRAIDDDSRVGVGAWEGVDKVASSAFAGQSLALFYLDFDEVAGIPNDVRFRLDTSQLILAGASTVQPADVIILLTVSGLTTSVDTIQSKAVRLSALTQNNGYLVSKIVDGVRRMYVTEAALSTVFPTFRKILFNAPTLEKKNLAGNSDAITIDSEFIVGPDR